MRDINEPFAGTPAAIEGTARPAEWKSVSAALNSTGALIETPGGRAIDLCDSVAGVRYSDPEDYPALAAELANLEPTEQAISQFVADFGFLGLDQKMCEPGSIGWDFEGESFETWQYCLGWIRVTWNALAGRQQPEGWRFAIDDVEHPAAPIWRYAELHIEMIGVPKYEQLLAPPRSLPRPRLSYSIDPASTDAEARDSALAQVIADHLEPLTHLGIEIIDGQPMRKVYSQGLIGTAWLQMANVLTGEDRGDWHQCPECHRWFIKNRVDQYLCGRSTCRGRAYDKRWKRARTLAESGLPVDAIAEMMSAETAQDISPSKVEKWLAHSMKRNKGVRL